MARYELRLRGADILSLIFETIDWENDTGAFGMVRQFVNGYAVELWQGARFLSKRPVRAAG